MPSSTASAILSAGKAKTSRRSKSPRRSPPVPASGRRSSTGSRSPAPTDARGWRCCGRTDRSISRPSLARSKSCRATLGRCRSCVSPEATETTETFKPKRRAYVEQGFDPARIDDPLFVLDGDSYVPLDADRCHAIQNGRCPHPRNGTVSRSSRESGGWGADAANSVDRPCVSLQAMGTERLTTQALTLKREGARRDILAKEARH